VISVMTRVTVMSRRCRMPPPAFAVPIEITAE
jgi:hypothetical protein